MYSSIVNYKSKCDGKNAFLVLASYRLAGKRYPRGTVRVLQVGATNDPGTFALFCLCHCRLVDQLYYLISDTAHLAVLLYCKEDQHFVDYAGSNVATSD